MTNLLRRRCTALVLSGTVACAAAPTARSAVPVPLSTNPAATIEMVLVKGGCFHMGADEEDCDATPEERPRHEVCVDDFSIGKYEVTRGQWRSIMGGDPSPSSTCLRDDCPVDDVTWSDVQGFIAKLNATSSQARYRLPTEAEWEYAARSGGRADLYSGRKYIDDLAWYAANSGKINHPVGGKAPNELGIHDMSGNVWEMTSDWYDATYYLTAPRDNPTGPGSGDDHVVRGGGRSDGRLHQRTTRRSGINDRTKGAGRGGNVGFRLVMLP
jgi:formylglycine-generating enzyme required for sulfatase activity